MPDTNDTDAILAKVRSGELSAGDAAALIANLHAASYKAMQDAQTAQAPQPEPPAPQAASQPGMSQQASVAAAAPCYQPQVPATPAYAAPTPDTVAKKAQETVPQHPQTPVCATTMTSEMLDGRKTRLSVPNISASLLRTDGSNIDAAPPNCLSFLVAATILKPDASSRSVMKSTSGASHVPAFVSPSCDL